MGAAQIRAELTEAINRMDERTLYMIYEVVMHAHGGLTLEQEKELAVRIARDQQTESASHTLQQNPQPDQLKEIRVS
ncbi:hypothetical protein [Dawidia soli]|uniref:Uncharacterized protein n=1 Tax=Dawidia soli TaxID=2782352 RepID=A0AAP2DCM3_9BACT|nr:hypothetical protein [Dawidia soli]MBT1686907.1 hypothetical protein [Dawidia soli]